MINRIFDTVTGGRLNLRASADSSSSILVSIPNETLLVVIDHNNTWYATTYGTYNGFVMKQYITLLDLNNVTEVCGSVTGGGLNLRRIASTSADRLIQIPNNTALTVIDFDADGLWYITNYNGYTGYVMKEYVAVVQPIATWHMARLMKMSSTCAVSPAPPQIGGTTSDSIIVSCSSRTPLLVGTNPYTAGRLPMSPRNISTCWTPTFITASLIVCFSWRS